MVKKTNTPTTTEEIVRKTAHKIAKKREQGEGVVDLDDPFKKDKESQKSAISSASTGKPNDSEPEKVAGYTAADVLKAPLETPTPEVHEDSEDVKTPNVVFLFGVGGVVALIGLILVFFVRTDLGIILCLVGMAAVALAVFVDFDKK